MQRGAALVRLHAFAGALKPWVRVIGLAYTGLGGMLAAALVVSVALVPVAPALQQVAEPARQAMNNLVQPTSDVVTTFFGGGPAVHIAPITTVASPDRIAPFSDAVSLGVTIADTLPEEPLPVVAAVARRTSVAAAQSPAAEAVDEIVGLEPIEISAPHAVVPVVVLPAPTAGLQIAGHEAPKALPTMPAPTETALQVKARLDVENQAAIDAAKATQARAKAEADAANNAAIAARKAAATPMATVSAPAMVGALAPPAAAATHANSAPTVKSGDAATPAPTPHSKAAANAANQAAIDAAKLAQARAKAESNAANQVALAAKGAKPSAKTTPTPTAQPTPAPAQPTTVQSRPTSSVAASITGVNAESQAPAVSGDVVEQQLDEALLENVPVDQA